MQIGNVWLVLDKQGSNVRLTNVTPAECLLLAHNDKALNDAKLHSHQHNAGRFPLQGLEIVGDAISQVERQDELGVWEPRMVNGKQVLRTDAEELARLRRKGYVEKMISMAFPGVSPSLPKLFSDVQGWKPDDQKVIDAKVPRKPAETIKTPVNPITPITSTTPVITGKPVVVTNDDNED
jgi:hypothetical protein